MMNEDKYDIVIIGAGVVGLSTAYHLVNKDTKTIVFEQFPVPHNRGNSHGHTRMIHHAFKELYYCQMAEEAIEMWRVLEKECGNNLIIQNGALELAPRQSKVLDTYEQNMKEIGLDIVKLSGVEIIRKFPLWRKRQNYDAILDTTGGIILADKSIIALLQMIQRKGGVIRDRVEVFSIETRFVDSVVLTTSGGVFQARKVVIAAGAWTSQILTSLHLDVPLRTCKTTVCHWNETEPSSHMFEKMPVFTEHDKGGTKTLFGIPSYEYPGLVQICKYDGTSCLSADQSARTDDSESIDFVRRYIKDNMDKLETKLPHVTGSCMVAVTPDNDIIVDKHPRWDHVIIGTGLSGQRFTLGIVVGRMLADLATDVQSHYDSTPFRISRISLQV